MDLTIPYLESQDSLLAKIKVLVRDSGDTRWSAAEKYAALNQVLMTWGDYVKMPHIYTISGGWVAGTYEYALPVYVRPPLYPELKRTVPYDDYGLLTASSHWQDVPGYEVVSDGAGGQVLRLYSPPRSVDGQVGFYSPNSRVPTTIPTTSGSTSSTATTMLLGSVVDIDDVGVGKCESEYFAYYGVTRGTATTTLLNIVHGLYGSTAATHGSASSVYWCVGVDTMSLWRLLMDMWKSCLASMFLNDGGTHETERFEKMLGYYDQLALNYFATYKPRRQSSPGLMLNRKAFALR